MGITPKSMASWSKSIFLRTDESGVESCGRHPNPSKSLATALLVCAPARRTPDSISSARSPCLPKLPKHLDKTQIMLVDRSSGLRVCCARTSLLAATRPTYTLAFGRISNLGQVRYSHHSLCSLSAPKSRPSKFKFDRAFAFCSFPAATTLPAQSLCHT